MGSSWTLGRIPRYSALLAALFVFLVVTPMLPLSVRGWRIVDMASSMVLIVGTLSVGRRHLLPFAWGLAIVSLAASWGTHVYPSTALLLVGLSFRSMFFILLCWVVIADVVRQRSVTTDTLAGAACGYLLLGVLWAGAYATLEAGAPGSFSMPDHVSDLGAADAQGASIWFVYFSFVTLTTLGFGDVAPATAAAGMLSAMEAVCGQLYVAVLIARLVAMHAVAND